MTLRRASALVPLLAVLSLLTACRSGIMPPGAGGAGAPGSDAGTPDSGVAPTADAGETAGALLSTRLESRVGVLLDELPAALRDRVADALLAESDEYWTARAKAQIGLAGYRLVFRNFFYEESEGKGQLPLPPTSLWRVALVGEPERVEVDGHDVVAVDYVMTSTLFTNAASVGEADPALLPIGGTWTEPFVFPIDPELLLQRTGYACMDEEEFPPNSVDGENVATFYDQDCEAGEAGAEGCHLTEAADEDCVEALERGVGAVDADLVFTRLPWDEALAESVRVGEVLHPNQPDVAVIQDGLDVRRVIYRYIDEGSCALAEGCVGGTGWRRLLQFDASVQNLGGAALDIGDVDYYLEGSGSALADHNIFEYSDCHEHYHFSYYGDFLFGSGDEQSGNKQAFCLQSTNRYSNNEASPLTHPYGACAYQGIQAGWGDDYGAGIECQWIDVTDVELEDGRAEGELSFVFNPESFLCEGEPVLDADGNPLFESTEFTTVHGDPVDRLQCDFVPGWDENNRGDDVVEITRGGLIASECERGQLGPRRDCGFTEGAGTLTTLPCEPGTTVTLRCSLPDTAPPAVLRACEFSEVLGAGTACVYRDALANVVVEASGDDVVVECPDGHSVDEPGGTVSLYTASLWPGDGASTLDCSVE